MTTAAISTDSRCFSSFFVDALAPRRDCSRGAFFISLLSPDAAEVADLGLGGGDGEGDAVVDGLGEDGQLSHVETKADKNSGGDESFASKLTETFEQMPAWQPLELAEYGIQESLLTYKIQFVPNTDDMDDVISEMVEANAQFPGGDRAYFEWLYNNIKYPEECLEKQIGGHVNVSFVINEDGTTSEIKVIGSPHPSLVKEAERLVKAMPRWRPATFGGEPIRSHFWLPITFRTSK